MRKGGVLFRRRGGAAAWACAAALAWAAAWPLPAAAQGQAALTIRGMEMNGYGRAVFQFEDLPKATVRVSNGILVVAFDRPIAVNPDKLPMELPSYVSTVRVDPDRKAIRFALTRPVRPNTMEAGEKLFLDLLPETWKGPAPGLPAEVIEELSRRAKDAEENARRAQRKKASENAGELTLRVGTTPTFSRLVFVMPLSAPVEFKRDGNQVELIFDAGLKFEASRLRAALPTLITAAEADATPTSLRLTMDVAPNVDVRNFREDDTYVLDFAPVKKAEAKKPEPSPEAPPPKPAATKPASGPPPAPPAVPVEAKRVPLPPVGQGPETPAPPVDITEAKITAVTERGSLRLGLGLPSAIPIAVFERGGVLWIAAETNADLNAAAIATGGAGIVTRIDKRRVGRLIILRLSMARPMLVRAGVVNGEWAVSAGDEVVAASTPITLARGVDNGGRTVIVGAMPDVGAAHWVEDPEAGDRLAIVTGRKAPRGLVKAQSFVDFRALATAQGLVITPFSDDVAVRTGIDDVTITRDGGLFVSSTNEMGRSQKVAAEAPLTINRDLWAANRSGNIRERARALTRAAAEASKGGRADARLNLARMELAAGLGIEAIGTLAVIVADDQDMARDRSVTLLQGIARTFANHLPEAAKIFASEQLAQDQEVVLWRAYVDGLQRRWGPALVGFRRSEGVIAQYPDDLQGKMLPVYAEAAVEASDFGLAQRILDQANSLDGEHINKPQLAYLGARISEGLGRIEDAFAVYDQLTKKAPRPVEAQARLSGIALALKDRTIDRKAAINQLEQLSVSWRGDEVEARTLALLARLYADEERWRDAFNTARKANGLFPDSDITRAVYDETASRFEALFLDGKADSIPRLDAVALYFDFKEFTPPGRRGDEMIRRLADRLLSLDLLNEAADLLTHQVENRLSGAAKAAVATRLSVLHLLNRQPAKAYQVLKDSRLAEMPADMRRARMLLEARALSDLSRTDLALEMIDAETGSEVERLRADILWQSRRWREAGEVFERMAGDAWQDAPALNDRVRADVMRAAIAFGLADDSLSLERLRAKFATKMGDSIDARAFSIVTSPGMSRVAEYRDLAKSVASADTLAEFLSEYRKRYPDTPALPPRTKRPVEANAQPDSAKPETGKPETGKPEPAKAEAGKADTSKPEPAKPAAAVATPEKKA